MGKGTSKLKKMMENHYGLIAVFIYVIVVCFYAIIKKDSIYVALTDNMDSNIPILKMIRDNDLFWELDKPIPFFGGVCLGLSIRLS